MNSTYNNFYLMLLLNKEFVSNTRVSYTYTLIDNK